ncbi:hypothetical protein ARMSODRAFT_925021 [Armillaria solidipes]|uniref:Transmembrane protein n=1 Tax=Armillaria solidipes TaxID=1076256 RepID=A0A2H3CP93_9AGAR|nr:hypothetical protein ARMSODRAFT_925021 [Armillaria solidipes]
MLKTPLAFLSPTLASQFEVSRYLLVATCGMFSWDVLTNMRNDYKIVTKYTIRLLTIVYLVSRIAAFVYIITGTVFTIGAVGDCQGLQVAIGCCFAVAVPATSLLFFFHVRAIFNANTWIVAFFAFLWLTVLGGSWTVPFAIQGGHIGPTDHCINTGVKPFSSTGTIISTVNDTVIFIAISWRLLETTTYDDSFKGRIRSFVHGKGLPAFSRSLLQSGQEYYLITVGGNILTMGMILAPDSLPAMYRDIKFGRINPSTTFRSTERNKSLPTFVAAKNQRRNISEFETETTTGLQDSVSTPEFISVAVEKSIHTAADVPMKVMLSPQDSAA